MDDRPSISELREQLRLISEGKLAASDAIQDAAPLLVEVVEAALAWRAATSTEVDNQVACDASHALCDALAEIRR